MVSFVCIFLKNFLKNVLCTKVVCLFVFASNILATELVWEVCDKIQHN